MSTSTMSTARTAGDALKRLAALAAAAATLLTGGLFAAQPAAYAADAETNVALNSDKGNDNAPDIDVSYVTGWNSTAALNDGSLTNSGSIGGWGTWGHTADHETATYTWNRAVTTSKSVGYYWTNVKTGDGGVLLPKSVALDYLKDDGSWAQVPNLKVDKAFPDDDDLDASNPVYGPYTYTFDQVTTKALRLVVNKQANNNKGITVTEWQVFGTSAPVPVDPGDPDAFLYTQEVAVRTTVGADPTSKLPAEVWATPENGPSLKVPVTWDAIPADAYAKAGTTTVSGVTTAGTYDDVAVKSGKVSATIAVVDKLDTDLAGVTAAESVSTITSPGVKPVLQDTVSVTYADGTVESGHKVTWDAIPAEDYDQAEDMGFVSGAIDGVADVKADGTFFVVEPSDPNAKPIVAIAFDTAAPGSGWYTTTPKFSITAQRGVSTVPIKTVEYKINDGAWTEGAGPVSVTEQGTVTVTARATDENGNQQETAETIKVDSAAPTVTAKQESKEGNDVVVSLTATDGKQGSGVTRVLYSTGPSSNPKSNENTMWGTYTDADKVKVQLSADHNTYVHYYAQDAAGNQSAYGKINLGKGTNIEPEQPTPTPGKGNVAPDATASASYTNSYLGDAAAAVKRVNDGEVSFDATDQSAKAWNNWTGDAATDLADGTTLTLTWPQYMDLTKAGLYFWADTQGTPLPKSWTLEYQDADGSWKPVALAEGQSYGVAGNAANEVTFAKVTTKALRAVFPKEQIQGVTEFAAYGEKSAEQPAPKPSVDSVAISGDGVADDKLALTEGDSAALSAEVKVTGGAAKTVSWKSSDDAVATVSDKGEVTAVAAGKATVTATSTVDASKKASIEVTVKAKEPEPTPDTAAPVFAGVSDVAVEFGASFDPLAGVSAKDDADGDVTGSIKVEGAVDTSKAGVYTLTYTVADKAGNTATATRKVTVREQKPEPKPTIASIAVTKKPAKAGYLVGEQLDTKGLEVTATLSDGKTRVLDASEYGLAGFDSSKPGAVTVTVTLKADPKVAAAFEVTVKAKEQPEPEPGPGDKAAFTDVDDKTPHKADIDWLAEHRISEGWDNGDGTRSFGPMRTVVRQDMAAFLYRLAGSPSFDESKVVNPFADVDESTPHYKEILWLYSTGISRGYVAADGSVTFGGMRTVVRQDMAAFLQRLADVQGASPELGGVVSFPDVTASTPHADAIEWLARAGVTTGFEDGTFGGMRDVVRQDMAAFLHRMSTNVLAK